MEGLARLPGLIAGELERLYPVQEIGQGDPGFQAGERGAEAEVDTVAEGDVRIRSPRNIEAAGVGELTRVAISGADDGKHERARRNRASMHLHFTGCGAKNPLDRRAVAEDLLDGRREQVGLRAKADKLVRVL